MKSVIKLLLITAFLTAGFYGCNSSEEPINEEHHEEHSERVILSKASIYQINLKTETIKIQPFAGYITIPAKVISNQDNEAQIGSLIQGRVYKVFVKVGDYVKVGQVLMTVEGLEIGEIKAGFLIAKAALDYSQVNYERQKKLYDEKIGSQKALLESQAEFEKAKAAFNAADKKIHSIGLTDEDVLDGKEIDEHTSGTLPIKSSINGIVVERNVVIGQLVDASTNAFKIINTNNVWIDGQVYEKDISKLSRNSNAVFTTGAYTNEKFNGKIIYIGQTIDEQTRTIIIRGEFNNPNNRLKPQMFGELKISAGENSKAIMIPEEAIVKEAGSAYVFVQTNETTFEKRNVLAGSSIDGLIEIKEGLKEGEKIVAKGVFYLKSELKKDEIEGDEH